MLRPVAGGRNLFAGAAWRTGHASEDSHIVCVAGGTGLAAVYQIAEDFGNEAQPVDLFVGARTANRLYFREECHTVGRVTLATDDGVQGLRPRQRCPRGIPLTANPGSAGQDGLLQLRARAHDSRQRGRATAARNQRSHLQCD